MRAWKLRPSRSRVKGVRRRVVGLGRAAVAASAGVALSIGPALQEQAALAAGPVSPATVAARLGANKIPAELVILVDISGSMTSDGLYPKVKRVLPNFLGTLRRQDPQDLVAVVTFGSRQDTQTVYLGRPIRRVPLPESATSGATDFGYAIQQALGILKQAPPRIQVGGVMLLSDGELDAPDDPPYASYSAPGWRKLRTMAQGLGMRVTGYGLPLSENPVYINSVTITLSQVFAQRQTLGPDLGNLGEQLNLAKQQVMNSRVATAVQPDIGSGARVSWPALPGRDGVPPLDLGAGHADLQLRLTSTASRVPLTVAGLSVTLSGFPVPVTGRVPGGAHRLAPGGSVTLPVDLSWPPTSGGWSLIGGSRSAPGRLTVTGRVTSPFTRTIHDAFADPAFRVGGLTGEVSAPLAAAVPAKFAAFAWLGIVLLFMFAGAGVTVWRARLGGYLVFTPPNRGSATLDLPRRPWIATHAEDVIRIPGRLTVRRLHGRNMRVTLRVNGSVSRGVLPPGGQTWVAGISIDHRATRDAASDRHAPYPHAHRA